MREDTLKRDDVILGSDKAEGEAGAISRHKNLSENSVGEQGLKAKVFPLFFALSMRMIAEADKALYRAKTK